MTFATYLGTEAGDAHALQAILDTFKARHPEDEVIHNQISAQEVPATIAQLIASGKAPDVFMLHAKDGRTNHGVERNHQPATPADATATPSEMSAIR